MKRFFILIVLAAALTGNAYSQTRGDRKSAGQTAEEKMLINYEKQPWAFLQQRDFKGFANLMADDFYGIFPGMTIIDKPKLLKLVAGFVLKDTQFGDFKVTILDKDAAIITYEVDEHVISDGKEKFNHNAITSGWAKRSGKWRQVFFQPNILKSTPV